MSNTNGAKSIGGGLLLFFGLFACCLLPLLFVGGGMGILSLIAEGEIWFALIAALLLVLALYAIYRRRKGNVGGQRCQT